MQKPKNRTKNWPNPQSRRSQRPPSPKKNPTSGLRGVCDLSPLCTAQIFSCTVLSFWLTQPHPEIIKDYSCLIYVLVKQVARRDKTYVGLFCELHLQVTTSPSSPPIRLNSLHERFFFFPFFSGEGGGCSAFTLSPHMYRPPSICEKRTFKIAGCYCAVWSLRVKNNFWG